MPAPEEPQDIYRFGEFELMPRERTLTRSGSRVALTPRMFDLLLALVEAKGRLVSKDDLLNTVWADAAVEEGNLNRTISALRKALGEKRNELKYIETVPKAGYRFVAKVDKGNGTYQPLARTTETPRSIETHPPDTPRSRTSMFIAIAAFVILFASLVISYFVFRKPPEQRVAGTSSDDASITRLTNNSFDEDAAMWTNDDRIRFIRFTAVNKVESMIMNADGSGQQRAGNEIRDFRAGTWSPDGKRVIFAKDGAPSRASFQANVDGSNEQPLNFNIGPFDWSPDGKQIVYSTNFPTENDNGEVVLYSFETGQFTNLTSNPAFDSNPSFSPDGRQVIFNSDRDGNHEIYLVNVDGTGLRRLTNDPAKEAFQAFSPDGTQIVFNSNRENEKVGIYLMNVNDDSQPVKLSETKYNAEIRPGCWSHDGTMIVFTSDMGGEKYNVYSMKVDSSRAKRVFKDSDEIEVRSFAVSPDGQTFALGVKLSDGRAELRTVDAKSERQSTLTAAENFDLMPSWSPDGRTIAMALKSEGNTEIYTINADGSELLNLTNSRARDGSPSWSPDGKKIVFSSDRDVRSEGLHLFTMNSDGSGLRRYSDRDGYEMTPAISPDGRMLAYACDRANGTSQALDIYVANVDDPASERNIAKRRFHDSNPNFSPDGRRIVFMSLSDGNAEIYMMNVDGSGLVRMTRNPADDTMPAFSRDGSKIYFVSNRSGKFALYEMAVR